MPALRPKRTLSLAENAPEECAEVCVHETLAVDAEDAAVVADHFKPELRGLNCRWVIRVCLPHGFVLRRPGMREGNRV